MACGVPNAELENARPGSDGGAAVRLVAAEVSAHVDREQIERGGGEARDRQFTETDLDGMRLAVTATGDLETDAAIAAAARLQNIWTNAADQPVDCDFILPTITRAGARGARGGQVNRGHRLATTHRGTICEFP